MTEAVDQLAKLSELAFDQGRQLSEVLSKLDRCAK